MLNIGKLAPGQQSYYLESVAKGLEDYYLGSGEAPGYWLGGGAEDLGLDGQVLERELTPILQARHPGTGEILTKRHYKARMPGFDLTFRAPKSVALLHALGPKDASNEVVNAHDSAVATALDYLERHAARGRRGTDGVSSIGSSGFVAAAFRHRTSRAGDPLLHTHVLAANLIHCDDGAWSALDGRLVYSHAKTAGYLYQAQLRHELSRRLEVTWTRVGNGTAEIEGVPRQVIDAFSRRRAEITARMQARGEKSAKAAQVATLDTRRAKDYAVSPEGLTPQWRARAKELGFSRRNLTQALGKGQVELTHDDVTAAVSELMGQDGLTKAASSFGVREVIQGLCERVPEAASGLDIEDLATHFLDTPGVVELSGQRSEGLTAASVLRLGDGSLVPALVDDARFSTEELLQLEEQMLREAKARVSDGVGVARTEELRRVLAKRASLGPEQRAMVGELATSGRGVEVVIGRAGTGKTFALDAARQAWESCGIRVIGCALSARAAKELQAGSGIESFTIAALMRDLEERAAPGLQPGSVVVVDEAGMVGTRQLHTLLGHASEAGAKVVLVGDDRQLPEIAAGGALRALKDRLPAIELTEVRRQTKAWERAALELLRQGRAAEAVATYSEQQRLVIGRDAGETRARIVADWWRAREHGSAVMIAARRADVADLNERARAVLKANGALEDAELRLAGRSFSVGDEVMTLRNDRRLGVINGTRGTVEDFDAGTKELTVRLDDERLVTLPQTYLEAGHVTHAYAITGHKAQGMTTDRAFVLGDESLYREWGYVAMSRGREENRLYVVMGEGCGRDDVGGAVDRPYEVDQLVRALERSRAKSLALDAETEMAASDRASLEAERSALYERLSSAPADRSRELQRLREEVERTQNELARRRDLAAEAQGELAAMGAVKKARNKPQVESLRERITAAEAFEERGSDRLRAMAAEETTLLDAQKVRERWITQHSPVAERAEVVEDEIRRRDRDMLRQRECDLPRYLQDSVGPLPERPSERTGWRQSVLAIEKYRDKYVVKDHNRALGGEPPNADQRWERAKVEATLEEFNDRRHGRSKDAERGLERSL